MKLLPVHATTDGANIAYTGRTHVQSEFRRREHGIAGRGMVSAIELAASAPYVAVLEDSAAARAQEDKLTAEAIFLKPDEYGGIVFALLPSEKNRSKLAVGAHNPAASCPAFEFDMGPGAGCMCGVITRELMTLMPKHDVRIDQPYVILFDTQAQKTIGYTAIGNSWLPFDTDATITEFIRCAKVIAAVDPELTSRLMLSKMRNAPLSTDAIHFYRKPSAGKNREIDKKAKDALVQIAGDVLGAKSAKGIGGAAQEYYNRLPKLIESCPLQTGLGPQVSKLQFKRSDLSAMVFQQVFESMATWAGDEPQLAKTFLRDTLPMLLSVTSLLRADNRAGHLSFGLAKLARQTGEKNIRILSPLCPSYCYILDENNTLRHASGEIVPGIGDRFPRVANTLGMIFAPLTQQGVAVDWEFLTYSGEAESTGYLVEVGQFVFDHYGRNTAALFESLQQAFSDLKTQAHAVFSRYGIQARGASIDVKLGKPIVDLINDFIGTFPKQLESITNENEVEDWLQTITGSRTLLYFFIEEEIKYRSKLEGLFPDHSRNLIPAALREALLYHTLINYALKNDSVIIDTETTSNYMSGTLRHLHAPVIMGREFDPLLPEGEFTANIRQPYNSQAIRKK